jgi:hypothetical protein
MIKAKTWTRVAPGIYRHGPTQALYERSKIDGRWTFRRLASHKVLDAKEELIEVRSKRGRIERGIDKAPDDKAEMTVGRVLQAYVDANCPDAQLAKRLPRTESEEKRRCKILTRYFERERVRNLNSESCNDYAKWRLMMMGGKGRRTIDHELSTLSNALDFSHIPRAQIRDRRKLYSPARARHCRDCAPETGDELHEIVRLLFAGNQRGHVLGWQALFEAFTGCRTNEVLLWRMDRHARGEPGFVESNKWLHLQRSKRGVNPWIVIDGRPELMALIEAHKQWHRTILEKTPWYFPSPENPAKPIRKWALTARLGDLHKSGHLKKKITSHGLRAFYVLVRRSQGISDGQIAAEIGDRTISLIETTYGSLPENWRGGNQVSFMPKGKPAWDSIIHSVIQSGTGIGRNASQPRNIILINNDGHSPAVGQ